MNLPLRRSSPQFAALLVGLAIVVVLFLGIVAAYYLGGRSAAVTPAAQSTATTAPAVAMARARNGTLDVTLATQGRIGPPAGSEVRLAFPLSGVLASVDVAVGDRVNAGRQLAALDRSGLANAVAQAQADAEAASATYAGGSVGTAAASSASRRLDAAQAHLTLLLSGGPAALSDRITAVSVARQAAVKVRTDNQTLDRQATLYRGGVIAQKDVQAARAQLQSDLADQRSADARVAAAGAGYDAALRQAQADVALARSDLTAARASRGTTGAQAESAQARVASAQRDYNNGILRAPNSGVVVAILKRAGESVDPATPVIALDPEMKHQITLGVPGADAQRVNVGDVAELTLVASGERSRGRVTAVVPAVDPTTQVSTIVLDGLPPDAVAGQAVAASIIVAHQSGIVIPNTAVVTDPETGKTVLFVYAPQSKNGPFLERAVAVGATDGRSIVIASGLRAGETIAVQGGYNLLAPSGG